MRYNYTSQYRPVSIMGYTTKHLLWDTPPSICYEIHRPVSVMRDIAHPLLIPDVPRVPVLYYNPTPTTTGHQSCWRNKIPVRESTNFTLSTNNGISDECSTVVLYVGLDLSGWGDVLSIRNSIRSWDEGLVCGADNIWGRVLSKTQSVCETQDAKHTNCISLQDEVC